MTIITNSMPQTPLQYFLSTTKNHLISTILFRIHMFYQHHPVDPAVDLPYQLQQT